LLGQELAAPAVPAQVGPDASANAPERKLQAEYFAAMSSQNREIRRRFYRNRTTAALRKKLGDEDQFLVTMGEQYYGFGRPELIWMVRKDSGGTVSLLRARESYAERLFKLNLKAERVGGEYRLAELRWEAV
jgi:hypothetical protein